MNEQVTVLIPFFNPGHYIIEAIDSVFDQTYKEWKIILVNDASTDNSVELILDYIKDNEKIKIIHNPKNVGQPQSMNIGLAAVDTPFVIQLDADDWLASECLEVLYNEMINKTDNVALVSGNMNMIFEDAKGNHIKSRIKKGRSFSEKYEFIEATRSVWPRFYRTDALRKVGGWPTDGPYKGRYVEDMRILYRLIEHYQFHWVDEVLYFHRRHANNETNMKTEYAETVKYLIRSTLKRWGGFYVPIFTRDHEGWVYVRLVKND